MGRTVTLTDESGAATGTADLLDAHIGKGKLHRAFSVYVFSPDNKQILIQRRSESKMLWPGIWANTCCSHPFEKESAMHAGMRQLKEELGFSVPLTEGQRFVYRAEDPFGNGIEHEHVTILIGTIEPEDAAIKADPKEVQEWKWVAVDELMKDMKTSADAYAPWFHLGLQKIIGE